MKVNILKQIKNQTTNHYEQKKKERIPEEKKIIYLITGVEEKKARKMLPCVAVLASEKFKQVTVDDNPAGVRWIKLVI